MAQKKLQRTNMGVQRVATKRNQQAEQVSNFVLDFVAKELENQKLIGPAWELVRQALFVSDLTRDRWDHLLTLASTENETGTEVWGQTTCYKGHANGGTESNKTYEVRETLTEALCLRARHSSANPALLVHFTYGNPEYVYGWFRTMKESVFDLSIYINDDNEDVFELIADSIGKCRTEIEIREQLYLEMKANTSLGQIVRNAINRVLNWWANGEPNIPEIALVQADLIRKNLREDHQIDELIAGASGVNVKKAVVDYLMSASGIGFTKSVVRVGEGILDRKPFLRNVKSQLDDWDSFIREVGSRVGPSESYLEVISGLWSIQDLAIRESLRRILLRLHSGEDVNYVQDLGVSGVTEHNLYSGNHSPEQVEKISSLIVSRLTSAGLMLSALFAEIARSGKEILRLQLFSETRNGTVSTSSFNHVVHDLEIAGYGIQTARECGISLVGYHAELTNQNVQPYTNFRVVIDQRGSPICLLKAKFFSIAEFDRRCKEEGFVALSLNNRWDGTRFVGRLSIPILMCIDMPEGFSPPAFSVKKMFAMGWDVVFGVEELSTKIEEYVDKR